MSQDKRTTVSVGAERAILVGVLLPDSTHDPRDPLGELHSLANTAGALVVDQVTQQRHAIDPGTYIGHGKATEIAQRVKAHRADVVIFDNDMSPNQLRDLEKICDCKILDRSELILDIFATRARTHEAQLQIALAQLQYTYPRLRHMWSHLERISGGAAAGVGSRGPGEMQLEIDRRLVRDKVTDLKHRIKEVQARKTREVETRKQQHFTISIVGYTNAGKSTLFNTLTGAGTFVEDKLFATLDTKTRRWHLGDAHSALISDTVGFVRDLPHHLVASFKATLEEATHADLLLVVLDVAHPHAQQQLLSVQQVLTDIGCGHVPALLLLNKIDAIESPDELGFWRGVFPDALAISAKEGKHIDRLTDLVRDQMLGRTMRASIRLPLSDARGATFIEKYSQVVARDYESVPGCVVFEVEMSQRILDQLVTNVPLADVTGATLSTLAKPWRQKTKPVRDLLPEAFAAEGAKKAAAASA